MKHGIDAGEVISTIAGSLIFEIRNNEFTREIRFNDKFILSQSVWRIIRTTVRTLSNVKMPLKAHGNNVTLKAM